jgi:hypothetical protein
MTARHFVSDHSEEGAARQDIEQASGQDDAQPPTVPASNLPPAIYANHGDVISGAMDEVASHVCAQIGDLRRTLDTIEQGVLEAAAAAKLRAQDHMQISARINDEIAQMQDAIREIQQFTQAPR